MKRLIIAAIFTVLCCANAHGQDFVERTDCPEMTILTSAPGLYWTAKYKEYYQCANDLVKLQSVQNSVVASMNILIWRENLRVPVSELICVFNQWPKLLSDEDVEANLVACQWSLYFQRVELENQWNKFFGVIEKVEEKLAKKR